MAASSASDPLLLRQVLVGPNEPDRIGFGIHDQAIRNIALCQELLKGPHANVAEYR